jgi:hypothetical protein
MEYSQPSIGHTASGSATPYDNETDPVEIAADSASLPATQPLTASALPGSEPQDETTPDTSAAVPPQPPMPMEATSPVAATQTSATQTAEAEQEPEPRLPESPHKAPVVEVPADPGTRGGGASGTDARSDLVSAVRRISAAIPETPGVANILSLTHWTLDQLKHTKQVHDSDGHEQHRVHTSFAQCQRFAVNLIECLLPPYTTSWLRVRSCVWCTY